MSNRFCSPPGWRSLRSGFKGLLIWAAAMPAALAQAPFQDVVIDFEELTEGQIVNQVSSGNGMSGDPITGFVGIAGDSFASGAASGNNAAIFDARCGGDPALCSGGDDDLFNPELGNILIVDQNGDADGDGFVDGADGPNDSVAGGTVDFDFTTLGQGIARVDAITFQDVDADQGSVLARVLRGDVVLSEITVPEVGDGKSVEVPIGVEGGDATHIRALQSVGIDNVEARVCEPQVDPADASASGAALLLDGSIAALGIDLSVSLSGSVDSEQQEIGQDSESNTSVTASLEDVVTARLDENSSVSEVDTERSKNTSRSRLVDISLLNGKITVDAVTARANAVATDLGANADTFGSRIQGLRIDGELVEISKPETSINIAGVGTLHILEKSTEKSLDNPNSASAAVNIIRLDIHADPSNLIATLSDDLIGANIIVGRAEAQAEYPRNQCVTPLDFKVSGEAAVVRAKAAGLLDAGIVTAGPIPESGGTDSSVALGLEVPGVINSGVAIADAHGGFDGKRAKAESAASVADFSLLDGAITGSLVAVEVSTEANRNGVVSSAETTLVDLVIDGHDACAMLGMASQDNTCAPPPNTSYPVQLPGGASVVFNAQSAGEGCGEGDASCDVHGIRVILPGDGGEVLVSTAHSDAQVLPPASQFPEFTSGPQPGSDFAGDNGGGGGGGCVLGQSRSAPDPLLWLMALLAALAVVRRRKRTL